MAEHSRIEWTDHTFNPWWDCTKLSPACDHCCAEVWARRTGHQVWCARSPRRFLSERPEQAGSLEPCCGTDRHQNAGLLRVDGRRVRVGTRLERGAGEIVGADRPYSTSGLAAPHKAPAPGTQTRAVGLGMRWPANVWLGTTVENQRLAVKRIPHLLEIPCRIRFLSCEPLLGPVTWRRGSTICTGDRRRRERWRRSSDTSGLGASAPRPMRRRKGGVSLQAVGLLVAERRSGRRFDGFVRADGQAARRSHPGRTMLE